MKTNWKENKEELRSNLWNQVQWDRIYDQIWDQVQVRNRARWYIDEN